MYDAKELLRVIETVVDPAAEAVDRTGTFPRESVDALAELGILGLTVPAELGGAGLGMREAADVVEQLAAACASTAMVVCMHYSGTAALVAGGREDALREIAAGRHLTTLAFSEAGSRSHFWAPVSTARAEGDGDKTVVLDAAKSWVTSAAQADSYVWSSRPLEAEGAMSLWYVRAGAPGLSVSGPFDGLGLRGNGSVPVSAEGVRVGRDDLLGPDGGGLDLALAAVLPWFLVLSATVSVGLMGAVTEATTSHLTATALTHLDQTLGHQLPARTKLARMRIETDAAQALVRRTLDGLEEGRPEAQLLVLEVKAAAGEAALSVTDTAMAACGGAAFRREVGVERRFRDARAARVMAPTTDALLDFVGRALCGLPLLDGPAA